jgi:3-hydroxybutyryl-CoA dehydrogenase
MKADDVRKVGVVGCGVMGAGIVEVSARVGLDVRYVEANPDLVERGRSRIEASILRAVERGKLEEQRGAQELTRIVGSTTIDDLADRDLVIEAATEHQETKREVFRRLDEVTRPEVVLASNTSSIPIVELAAVTGRPAQVVGMHFFNPVPVMGLIEVVRPSRPRTRRSGSPEGSVRCSARPQCCRKIARGSS